MSNYIVVATDIRPPTGAGYNLDHTGYRRCGQYDGQPPMGMASYLECDNPNAIGRYVYVYLPTTTSLIMCEFEVFGVKKDAPGKT